MHPQTFIHGSKLKRKVLESPELKPLLGEYGRWSTKSLEIKTRTADDIKILVNLLNDYKSVAEPVLDSRMNSAQEVLQPSILEEFFEYLFCRLDEAIGAALLRKPSSAFIDLVFNPRDIKSLATKPEYTIHRKDHDFVIGASLSLTLTVEGQKDEQKDSIVIPAVAIECKRYLERNMLDECSGTADRVKKATPYCLFFVVAEYLKMDDCRPELSKIDEIYILRKQRNSERLAADFKPNPIDDSLIFDLYTRVLKHLSRIWWNPDSALTTGKLFDYPK